MKPNGADPNHYFVNMQRMVDLLGDVYTPIQAAEWLLAKHDLLGGQSPAEMIARGKTTEVEQLIDQIKDGAFL